MLVRWRRSPKLRTFGPFGQWHEELSRLFNCCWEEAHDQMSSSIDVHEDAERIEHVLGEDVVRQLEKRLNYAKTDPHGRPIPSLDDMGRGAGGLFGRDELVGYGKPA